MKSYEEITQLADLVIDANTYEVHKSVFKSLKKGSVIDFVQTLKFMQRRDIDVAIVHPDKEEVIDTNFEEEF